MPTLEEALIVLLEIYESTGPGSSEDRHRAAMQRVDQLIEQLPRDVVDRLMKPMQ